MTVLDASVLISYFGHDAHTDTAAAILTRSPTPVRMHPVTLAEVLAGPARRGTETRVRAAVAELGIEISHPDDDEPLRVARLRASTMLKLPDCYVLALAEHAHTAVASFDDRLRAAAAQRGVAVLPT